MKKIITNLIKFFITVSFFLSFSISAQTATAYSFDPNHSYVLWHISHFGFSNPSGKWFVTGTLILDQAHPQNSKVNATINIADIVTGIKELDDHLKGQIFFDVAQFPTATFVSDKINVTSKTTAKVHGMLTLHGVTKPVILDVTLNKAGVNPITNKDTVGFSAITTLKRSDFGINTLLPGLGDDVKINIDAEAYKSS